MANRNAAPDVSGSGSRYGDQAHQLARPLIPGQVDGGRRLAFVTLVSNVPHDPDDLDGAVVVEGLSNRIAVCEHPAPE